MAELVSQREFARRRGVNPGYIAKLKSRGILVMVPGPDGALLVDVDASNAAIERARDPAKDYMAGVNAEQRERHGKPPVDAARAASQGARDIPVPPEGAGSPVSVLAQKARAQSAVYDARMRQLEFEQRSRKVVPRAEVKAAAQRLAALIVTGLSNIGARIGPVLAAEADPAACQRLIDEELRKVREDFAAEAEKLYPEEGATRASAKGPDPLGDAGSGNG